MPPDVKLEIVEVSEVLIVAFSSPNNSFTTFVTKAASAVYSNLSAVFTNVPRLVLIATVCFVLLA